MVPLFYFFLPKQDGDGCLLLMKQPSSPATEDGVKQAVPPLLPPLGEERTHKKREGEKMKYKGLKEK